MPVWPDIATAAAELRTYLNDGPTDRPVKQKQLVGEVDGTNTEFFAFEERVVVGSLVVNVNFTPVASVLSDAVLGLVTLPVPPARGSVVRARYYYQYFLQSELQESLIHACGQILSTEDVTQIPLGLKEPALAYAAYFAYTKQAIRWAQRMSQKFLLEEDPIQQETMNRSNLFRQLAKGFMDEARIMRDDYYKRQSRQLAPAATVTKPFIPWIGTRR